MPLDVEGGMEGGEEGAKQLMVYKTWQKRPERTFLGRMRKGGGAGGGKKSRGAQCIWQGLKVACDRGSWEDTKPRRRGGVPPFTLVYCQGEGWVRQKGEKKKKPLRK